MTKKEILEHLKEKSSAALFKKADQVRRHYCGDSVYVRGIIEFSNYCVRHCLYCGLRRENKAVKRYRLMPKKIVEIASQAVSQGIHTIVLQSGDDFGYSRENIASIVQAIKKQNPGLAITLAVGERPLGDYRAFFDAGADRYLLKHETSNEMLYRRLHPSQSLKRRLEIIFELKRIGYQIGIGCIIGLPGQTAEDLYNDLLLFKEVQPDMAAVGPFIPQSHTPLAKNPSPPLELVFKMIALSRIVTKNSHIPATTAIGTLGGKPAQIRALKVGANIIMPNFTPLSFRKKYKIYNNKSYVSVESAKEIVCLAGRKFCLEKGDSLKRVSY
jgi:biotin synthase